MKTVKSKPDIVKKMREIRDQLSLEIMALSFEQEKQFLKSRLDLLKAQRQKKIKAATQ